jgi:spore maturation protein CgeB
MRILIIGKFYREGFGLHIAETLTDMGHQVRRYEPGIRSGRLGGRLGHRLDQVRSVIYSATDNLPKIRARRMRALSDVVERSLLDLVLVCHDFLWPSEVSEIKRRSGAQVVLWFPDALVNFGRGYFMNADYDALFFKDPYIVYALREVLRIPMYYLPECFNPKRHRLPEGEQRRPEYACDIATAGNLHSWRYAFYRHLVDYDVKLWGQPPPLWLPTGTIQSMHQGRLVLNEDKARAFLGAKVVVNNLHYGEIWGVNVRTFEAAGIGAFQMVDWRPGLAQLFEDGKELVSFRGIADLKEKLDFWLPKDEERREIAAAGKRRAHSEHTYRHRLDLLLATLAGQEHGYPLPRLH